MLRHENIKTKSRSSSHPELIAFGSILALTLISGAVLTSSRVKADDAVVDDVSIEVPVSCSMSGTGTNTHNATLINGTYSGGTEEYTNGIGSTTLSVFCNDNNGFSVYAAGYTGNEVGAANSNKLVGASTGLAIPTGVYTSGDTTSKWSMKLTAGTDSGDTTNHPLTIDNGFNSFHTVPGENEDYVRVAHKDAATAMSGTPSGATLTTTYDAYISATQTADTYTGQVKYVMVHPYQQDDSNAPSTALIMQNVSQWKDSIAPGQEVTAMDARDNKTYTVAKLADGNLWMTQNLDLDLGATTLTHNSTTLYSDDTDLPANATWTPERATYTTGTTNWNGGYYDEVNDDWAEDPNGVDGYTHPESYDPGELYWNGTVINDQTSCEDAGGTWNSEYMSCNGYTNPTSSTGNSHYHLGNYYNWTAAVAMNDTSELTTAGTLIEQSICPAGWTLPRVGSGDDTFGALWNAYNFNESSFTDANSNNTWDSGENALWTSPLYFAASGSWFGELGEVGDGGDFWSPVVYDDGYAGGAYFSTNGFVGPDLGIDRYAGGSVRCVARPVTSAVSLDTGGEDETHLGL